MQLSSAPWHLHTVGDTHLAEQLVSTCKLAASGAGTLWSSAAR